MLPIECIGGSASGEETRFDRLHCFFFFFLTTFSTNVPPAPCVYMCVYYNTNIFIYVSSRCRLAYAAYIILCIYVHAPLTCNLVSLVIWSADRGADDNIIIIKPRGRHTNNRTAATVRLGGQKYTGTRCVRGLHVGGTTSAG